MEQVIKAFLGVFIAVMMIFAGIGVMNTSIQAKNADIMIDSIASAWEASNHMLTAGELSAGLSEDYQLSIDTAKSAANGNVSYAIMKLRYKYRVPLLGIEMWRETRRSLR